MCVCACEREKREINKCQMTTQSQVIGASLSEFRCDKEIKSEQNTHTNWKSLLLTALTDSEVLKEEKLYPSKASNQT